MGFFVVVVVVGVVAVCFFLCWLVVEQKKGGGGLRGVKVLVACHINSELAQRKRVGLITQRS